MTEATELTAELIEIAMGTYRDEILDELPPEKRYIGAMVANAAGIAQRRLSNPDPGAALVETLGGETMESIAKQIRKGEISDESNADLGSVLLDHLRQELRITNPNFLTRRDR